MSCVHPLHLHKGQWCVSAPILCRFAWKSFPKSSHCDLFGRLGCAARLSSNLSILIRGGLGRLFSTTPSMLLSVEANVTLTSVALYFPSLSENQPSQYHVVIHGWDSTGGRPSICHQPAGSASRYARVLSIQQWVSAKGVDEDVSPIEVLADLTNGFLYCCYFCQSTNMVTAWDLLVLLVWWRLEP
jgi:hypothetical protein